MDKTKRVGKFAVAERFYLNGVFELEVIAKRMVYLDKHGSPFISDTLHGCRVFCMGENPSWYRADAYSIPSRKSSDAPTILDHPTTGLPVPEDRFPGLQYKGLRHPENIGKENS